MDHALSPFLYMRVASLCMEIYPRHPQSSSKHRALKTSQEIFGGIWDVLGYNV